MIRPTARDGVTHALRTAMDVTSSPLGARCTDDRRWLKRKTRPRYADGQTESLRVVDLFAGCGGMTLGMAQAAHEVGLGIDVRLAVDFERDAAEVFEANFPHARVECGRVEEFFSGGLGTALSAAERETRRRAGRVDALIGGPPCQGNSDLNNHTRRGDPRNQLYLRMARAAQVLRPNVVIIENVPAVVHDRGRVVELAMERIEELDYCVAQGTVDLSNLGVPQRRRRHFLIATRHAGLATSILSGARSGRLMRRTRHPRTVAWAIEDLLGRSDPPGTGFDSPGRASTANQRRIDWLFERDVHVLDDSERPPCHRDKPHSYRSVYGRMRWDKPAQTITTGFGSMGQGCFVHPRERRTITPHEAARLQTFPDFFSFASESRRTAWARLVGNAVPPFATLSIARAWLRGACGEIDD